MKRRKKPCRNCGRHFIPDRYNSQHQHYCSNPECRHASSKASKKKYRKKLYRNEEYRKAECERIKNCQRKRSLYHRNRKKSSKNRSEPGVLRDIAQVEKLQNDIEALRDIAIWQDAVIKGLVSTMTDGALRDDIGVVCNRLYDRGKEISGMGPEFHFNIKSTELHNETQRTNRIWTQAKNT